MLRKLSLCVSAALFALPGCSKDDSAPSAPATEAELASADKLEKQKAEESADPSAPTKLETDDFTAPIPKGYKAMPSERMAGLSAQTGQKVAGVLTKPRAAPDHFVTSFIFTLIASEKEKPTEGCAVIAEGMAKATGTKAEVPKLVEFPFGKTCQFEMGDDKQRAIQTIVFVGKKWWTLTCNFDPRDKASPTECNEVLAGFAGR